MQYPALKPCLRICALIALSVGLLVAARAAQATATGTAVAWGCGMGADQGQCSVPTGLSDLTAVAGGGYHSLALKEDGTVVAWGCRDTTDLGQCSVPSGLSDVAAVAAGYAQSLALKADGTVVAWGCSGSEYGQCNVPSGLTDATAIAAGVFHSLALRADGTVVAWGSGLAQDVPSGLAGVTAIAAGTYHNLALKSDGTVVAWGCDATVDYGQCNVPAGLTGVTAIAAAQSHSLALKNDGTVVAWGCGGSTDHGQCSVPSGLANVIAIAAGTYHSLALKADGTVIAWGCGPGVDFRQCGVPSGLSSVSAIAAGGVHSLAVAGGATPDAPTNVSASPGRAQATVNWKAPAFDGGHPVTGYEVTSYVGGVVQNTVGVGLVTQATIGGLTPGVSYTFRVAARNALGLGALSAESNAVTPSVPRYTLDVSNLGTGNGSTKSDIGGIDCGATCTVELDAGTTVTLTATAAADSTFAEWMGDCTGTSGACTLTMDQDRHVHPVFTLIPTPKTLTATRSGAGAGTVTIASADGVTECSSFCSREFPYGTTVTLTATPAVGSTFSGWTGDCFGGGTCTLTMDRTHFAAAVFGLVPGTPKTLSVNRTGGGGGSTTIVYPGGLTDCFGSCARQFANGTPVTLSATAAAGSTFTGWTGDCSGTGSCKLTMDQDHAVTAAFALIPPPTNTLTVVKAGSGAGTVTSNPDGIDCGSTCTRDFAAGTEVTLTATAAAGSTFAGWSGACSGSGACTVAMDAAKTATATFNQVQSPPKTVRCVVPNVKGKPLATARTRIAVAHCRTGNVAKVKSRTVATGKVISQRPKAGTKLAAGSKVSLVISRGRR